MISDSVISETVYVYLRLHNLAIYLLKFPLPVLFEYVIRYSIE